MILAPAVRWWHCPACDLRDRTQQDSPHTQFHNCAALGGIAVPMIETADADSDARGRQQVAVQQDYVGDRLGVTYLTDGRPVAAVLTERADGSNDCTVLAPTAGVKGENPNGLV